VKKLLSECEPSWTALRKALEEEELDVSAEWGQRSLLDSLPKVERTPDIIRKHEEKATGIGLSDKGA
jgi:Cft2 family RNA processing exonuclease